MPMDLLKLESRRQAQKANKGPLPTPTAVAPSSVSQELAAAASAVCVALADTKECRVCGGASWLGKHTRECPIPELENSLKKMKCFEVNIETVENSPTVYRDENGIVFIHGVEWSRWLYLNPAQRVDMISRRHNKPRAVKIVCNYCNEKSFVIAPLRGTQRITECWDCWSIRSRPLEAIKIATKEAIAKAKWSREQKHVRAVHRVLTQKHARHATTMLKILQEAVGEHGRSETSSR